MKARWDLVLLPPLVISLVLLLASQLVFLKGSLQQDLGMGVMAPGLTLDNFLEIFTDPYFVSSLWLSISVSTIAMVITLLIAFPAAYAIARMEGHLSIVLLAAVVVSSFLSIVVKVLGLLLIFSSSGPLNKTLFWLGVISEPVTIVGNIPGVILGLIYYTLGFAILLFYSIVVTVPRSLEEAAEIHGASRAGVFRQVVMPLCLPGIAAGALMIFNVNMGGFSSTALIGAGKILTLPIVIQRTVILETNYGLGAALAAAAARGRARHQRVFRGAAAAGAPRHDRLTMLHYRTRRRLFSALVLTVAYVTLLAPIAFVMIASFDYGQRAYVIFPPDRFTFDSYWRIPMRYWDSLWISVRVAFLCMLISCAIGIPAAIGIVRCNLPGKAALLAIFRAPMQIPAVVSGVAFLHLYYLLGPLLGVQFVGTLCRDGDRTRVRGHALRRRHAGERSAALQL